MAPISRPAAARAFPPHAYRYPHEHLILALTLLLVLGVIAVTATATLCGSAVFVALMLAAAYASTRAHHAELLRHARRVTPEAAPALAGITAHARGWLGVEPVEVYVLPSRALNAYTFGLGSPKVIVINSALLRVLDADETAFVIGHELGHVRLGHTWLNSLVGGLAGIPSPYVAFALLHLALRWWNRACEHSADRAGLLACRQPDKAVSALVKLALGPTPVSAAQLEQAIRHVEAGQAEAADPLAEALATHPRMQRRIHELRRWAASAAYRRLAGR